MNLYPSQNLRDPHKISTYRAYSRHPSLTTRIESVCRGLSALQ